MTDASQRPAQPRRYISYYRVSTGDQQASGLGLDAQMAMVREYVAANPGRLVAEFSEVMSGRRSDRPQLAKALSLCKITRSTLVIARLDRLSRSVQLIVDLMEAGIEFVAVDFPHANKFTIHILAALAEYESSLNSDRMKSIAKALKERGVKRVTQILNSTQVPTWLLGGQRQKPESPNGGAG